MSFLSRLANTDIGPRPNAREYGKLYGELKALAKEMDQKEPDLSIRAGEVVVREPLENVYINFGYQRDEHYVGEGLSLTHTQMDDEGKRTRVDSLRAGLIDKSDTNIALTHLVDSDGDSKYETAYTVHIDTVTNTITTIE